MDANSGATVASLSQQVQVELVQEDIPGAALQEPLDVQNVAALHWWLQCRGIFLEKASVDYKVKIQTFKHPVALYLHAHITAIKKHCQQNKRC